MKSAMKGFQQIIEEVCSDLGSEVFRQSIEDVCSEKLGSKKNCTPFSSFRFMHGPFQWFLFLAQIPSPVKVKSLCASVQLKRR